MISRSFFLFSLGGERWKRTCLSVEFRVPPKKKIERLITGYWGLRVVETGNNPTYKKLKILVWQCSQWKDKISLHRILRNRPFHGFFSPTFFLSKIGKICLLRWKERLSINKIAKFEIDLLKTNKDIAPQSRNIFEKFVWWGYKLSPHHTTAVNFRNFAYVYLCSLKTFHFQTWQVHGNCPTFFSNRSSLNRIKTWKAKTPQSEFVTWLLATLGFECQVKEARKRMCKKQSKRVKERS